MSGVGEIETGLGTDLGMCRSPDDMQHCATYSPHTRCTAVVSFNNDLIFHSVDRSDIVMILLYTNGLG